MPRKPRRPALPSEIKRVYDRLEDWRRTKRTPRERIPDRLWSVAAALCKDYSVHRVSRWLRLNHSDLKARVEASATQLPELPVRQAAASKFLEVVSAAPSSSPECIVELEDARGVRMKIHLKGSEVQDLAALTKLFWTRA